MTRLLRRQMMALMLGTAAISFTAPFLFDAPAFAKDGSDDGGSSGSGSSGSGDSDGDGGNSGSSGDSDGDDSGNDGGSGDDDGTPDQGSGDNGSDDDNDDDDSGDDSDDDDNSSKKADKASKRAGRPTATITLSSQSLASVRAGTHVVVDQLGRQLEITVRTVNGQQVISAKPHGGAAKRNPGPINTINVVPVSNVAGDDDGTPDQGSGDN